MKKVGLFQRMHFLLALALPGLVTTGCVQGPLAASYWKTIDGILIVLVFLFLVGYTLATMRSDKEG
ncbi:MAG: hypothetical protein H7Z75_02245 [Ferruginibacter sp.]|nr:hypothetical protein [Cytophagales bacterium]